MFVLLCTDVTLSTLHSHYAHRTSANLVLGPAGPGSAYRSHRQEDLNPLANLKTESQRERYDHEEEKRPRSQPKTKRKKRRNMITANLSGTRYEVSKYHEV